jgi:protein-S-isoprenylcysteine O-methyltransferase Ste14
MANKLFVPMIHSHRSEPGGGSADRHETTLLRLRPALVITMLGVLVLLLVSLSSATRSLGERIAYHTDMQAVQMVGYLLVLAGLALAYVRISAPSR